MTIKRFANALGAPRGGGSIMHRSIRTAAFATTIAALLVAPGVTWAQAETVPTSGQSFIIGLVFGEIFFDEGGHTHGRNWVVTQAIFGTLSGTQVAIVNTVQEGTNPATGQDGVFWGSATFNVESSPYGVGTFEGTFTGRRVDGILTTHSVHHGVSGDFVGMTLKTTTTEINLGVSTSEGTLLSPQGF